MAVKFGGFSDSRHGQSNKPKAMSVPTHRSPSEEPDNRSPNQQIRVVKVMPTTPVR